MKRTRYIFLCLILTIVSQNLIAQDPHFFHYNDENGLPSNEVYSVVKDKKGFIWLGCDAGLYKFDGIRYIPYSCPSQKSKSASGLTVAPSGKLYCTNFQSQIFYIENDVLKELDYPFSAVLHITCDQNGNLIVNHNKGFAVYNEAKRTWKNHVVSGLIGLNKQNHATRSARMNANNEACFLTAAGIGTYKNNRFEHTSHFSGEKPVAALSADFMIEWFGEEQWIFPFSSQNKIYRCKNGVIEAVTSKNLLKAMAGKATTSVKQLSDGNLWICTYTGIVRYNPTKDIATVYYPNLAFSDCLIDGEGNYWFSTLQSGLIRIPNLEYKVWNSFQNNKLTRLTTDGTQIYFATVNGDIGFLDKSSNLVSFLQSGNNSSIQTLTHSPSDNCIFFYTNKNLYSYRNGGIELLIPNGPPTKHIITIRDQYLISSSFGMYVYSITTKSEPEKITDFWSREAKYDEQGKVLWVATNNGLLRYESIHGKWQLKRTFFRDKQILSIDLDPKSGQLFAMTFEGELHSVQRNNVSKRLYASPTDVQTYRVQYHRQKVYVATNHGVLVVDLKTGKQFTLNVFSGLASNNVLDLTIVQETMWLATGKGLQKIPLNAFNSTSPAIVYLKNRFVDPVHISLNYGQTLVLHPETKAYGSNGNFEYAYRINGRGEWTRLPGSIERIQLQNIPSGDFEIELKVIDHLGQDSKNVILLKGYASPPFWFSWWFIALEILFFLGLVFLVFKRQLAKRQKEFYYQQELNALKLTAIKSQMNPHFIFNVLSSIKGYIYENDRQKATAYLDSFSDLMRTVLEMSEVHYVSIAEELKLLKLYIDLEAMMLEHFTCEVEVDDDLDIASINIPSLVLQPYIENAFKHGLRHKQGEKKLSIRVSKRNSEELTIELTDNGIGRKAAAELNKNNALKPQSFAGQALEKRIALINRQSKQHLQLEIIDLYDGTGNACGTTILLTLNHGIS